MSDERQGYIERAVRTSWETIGTYNKSLLTLSSGFLAITAAFIGNTVELRDATHWWLLFWGGLMLVATIFMTLVTLIFIGHEAGDLIGLAAKDVPDSNAIREREKTFSRRLLGLTIADGLIFACGVVLVLAFVWTNLPKGQAAPVGTSMLRSDDLKAMEVTDFDIDEILAFPGKNRPRF